MFRYVGGKGLIAKRIVDTMLEYSYTDQKEYIEPFVGAGNTMLHMKRRCGDLLTYKGSDTDDVLIKVLQLLQSGNLFLELPKPEKLTNSVYTSLRYGPLTPVAFFVGHACGYRGAKFCAPFDKERTVKLYRSALHKANLAAQTLLNIKFSCLDYRSIFAELAARSLHVPVIIYCDPPYKIKHRQTLWKHFDHEEFWEVVRYFQVAHMESIVFISEMTAPPDFVSIWHHTSKDGYEHKERTEHLFVHNWVLDPTKRVTVVASPSSTILPSVSPSPTSWILNPPNLLKVGKFL